MEKRKEFAKWIRSIRKNKGLSKFSAGQGLGYKSDGTINSMETGRGPIPVEKIHPIAKLYEIDIEELLTKIKECEPELFAKYCALEQQITSYYKRKVLGHEIGARLHHAPFPSALDTLDIVELKKHKQNSGLQSIYYQTLMAKIYTLLSVKIPPEQTSLKFPKTPDLKQKTLFNLDYFREAA